MKRKPRVALLRGGLLSPFEMQSYEDLQDDFELVAIHPHQTHFDTTKIHIPKESLWCPILGKVPLERELRKLQVFRDRITGQTHSFCGLRDRLEGFDLYHIMDQYFCFGYEAALARRKFGGKLVVTQWENIPHVGDGKTVESHIKRTVREQADLFLAMSELSRQVLLAEGVETYKIQKVFAGVDISRFTPGKPNEALRVEIGIPKDSFVILYVGRLSRSKGVFTLLEAFRRFTYEIGNVHLLLVGRDEDGIAKWIAQQGLANRAHLAGFVPYDKIVQYYQLGDVMVLPSLPKKTWLEQFGYVLAEAMACGTPVVGSDCGTIPEVVGDPDRIFSAGSVEGLIDVLRMMKKTGKVKWTKAMRQRACDLFSSRKFTQNLRSFYWELLSKP